VRTIETNEEILETGGKVRSAECLTFLSNIYYPENWVKAAQSESAPLGVETHCHTITCLMVREAAAAVVCVCVFVCVLVCVYVCVCWGVCVREWVIERERELTVKISIALISAIARYNLYPMSHKKIAFIQSRNNLAASSAFFNRVDRHEVICE